MRDAKFICCQPDDTYYTWQVHMWLESLRNLNLSHKAIVLIFGVESWVVATTITINLLRIVVTFIAFEIVKKGVTK